MIMLGNAWVITGIFFFGLFFTLLIWLLVDLWLRLKNNQLTFSRAIIQTSKESQLVPAVLGFILGAFSVGLILHLFS